MSDEKFIYILTTTNDPPTIFIEKCAENDSGIRKIIMEEKEGVIKSSIQIDHEHGRVTFEYNPFGEKPIQSGYYIIKCPLL